MSTNRSISNIKNAIAWKFQNIPISYFSNKEKASDKVKELESDINIGFEKDQREILLKHLEPLTRLSSNSEIRIPLIPVTSNSPHHLDNENETIKFEKQSFKQLIIKRTNKGRIAKLDNSTITLELDFEAVNELFTRIYVTMEIYATIDDNILTLENQIGSKLRLVIWGVKNGKPIYY